MKVVLIWLLPPYVVITSGYFVLLLARLTPAQYPDPTYVMNRAQSHDHRIILKRWAYAIDVKEVIMAPAQAA